MAYHASLINGILFSVEEFPANLLHVYRKLGVDPFPSRHRLSSVQFFCNGSERTPFSLIEGNLLNYSTYARSCVYGNRIWCHKSCQRYPPHHLPRLPFL